MARRRECGTDNTLTNGLDPETYLRLVLERVAEHPINRVRELLPWAKEHGVPIVCMDARHAKAALAMQVNKPDENDGMKNEAETLTQIHA